MHEMSLALSIIEQTREAAANEGALRILEVEIEVGCLAGVLVDSLQFCLEAVGASDGLCGTVFRVTEVGATGDCRVCAAKFPADSFLPICPGCGSDEISLSGGRELKIRSLTIED
ncbi:MAG: hydrogenase maturation nickel metallochaperone HypA [Desulfobulbaceae bacterium]|nr:hydrogenase maturation nickel metallochaperone HypA [Desulfobulbaceae bacterium]